MRINFTDSTTVLLSGQIAMPELYKFVQAAIKTKSRNPDVILVSGIWMDRNNQWVILDEDANEWAAARNLTEKTAEVYLEEEKKWVRLKPFIINSDIFVKLVTLPETLVATDTIPQE